MLKLPLGSNNKKTPLAWASFYMQLLKTELCKYNVMSIKGSELISCPFVINNEEG